MPRASEILFGTKIVKEEPPQNHYQAVTVPRSDEAERIAAEAREHDARGVYDGPRDFSMYDLLHQMRRHESDIIRERTENLEIALRARTDPEQLLH